MRREVVNVELRFAIGVCIESANFSSRSFRSHSCIKAAALVPVLEPLDKFRIADAKLGLSYCPTADAIQDKLMPELIFIAQLSGFPCVLTSPIALSSAMVSGSHKGPRSGSASPVMSSGENTGLLFSSTMQLEMR